MGSETEHFELLSGRRRAIKTTQTMPSTSMEALSTTTTVTIGTIIMLPRASVVERGEKYLGATLSLWIGSPS